MARRQQLRRIWSGFKTCVNIEGHRKDKKDAKNSTQFVARKLNWTAWNCFTCWNNGNKNFLLLPRFLMWHCFGGHQSTVNLVHEFLHDSQVPVSYQKKNCLLMGVSRSEPGSTVPEATKRSPIQVLTYNFSHRMRTRVFNAAQSLLTSARNLPAWHSIAPSLIW